MTIIKNRKYWIGLSTILFILSVITIGIKGFNFGIDFTGGTLMEIEVDDGVTVNQISDVLSSLENSGETIGAPKIQASTAFDTKENHFMLRTRELNDENHTLVVQALSSLSGYQELSYTRIGPVVGENLRSKAIKALIIAIILIILFIAWAFRKIPASMSSFRFGLIAVVALIHDVTITAGVFSLLGLEIDSFFIVAILTILGFSVNDTIVVFDRVRETLIRREHADFEDIAEYSIESTFKRSINTSLTVIITLLALFFFAEASIQNFILALIIGMFIGTYSSIFVATPLLVIWEHATKKRK